MPRQEPFRWDYSRGQYLVEVVLECKLFEPILREVRIRRKGLCHQPCVCNGVVRAEQEHGMGLDDQNIGRERPASLDLRVFAPSAAYNNPRRRVLADFRYRGVRYAFWVTDPVIEREYKVRDDDTYQAGESCLGVSLGEPFHKGEEEFRYKLVAAVIQREGARPWAQLTRSPSTRWGIRRTPSLPPAAGCRVPQVALGRHRGLTYRLTAGEQGIRSAVTGDIRSSAATFLALRSTAM